MAIPSLTLTAILTASSSRQRPHVDMDSANSQSPLCGDDAARNEASWKNVLRLDSTKARHLQRQGGPRQTVSPAKPQAHHQRNSTMTTSRFGRIIIFALGIGDALDTKNNNNNNNSNNNTLPPV